MITVGKLEPSWHTQETNHTARVLCDKLARNRGFIRSEIELSR